MSENSICSFGISYEADPVRYANSTGALHLVAQGLVNYKHKQIKSKLIGLQRENDRIY